MMQPLTTLDAHRIVPAPVSVTAASGAPFALTATTTIVVPAGGGEAGRVGEMLAALFRPATGLRLPVASADSASPNGAIVLRLGGAADLGAEGYDLTVDSSSVQIVAASPAGLFHGAQTLRQLLPAAIEAEQSSHRMANAWTVPPGHIVDRPRFAWRGSMLDVARHFFTVGEVEQYIDLLALYKLNTLHLHLSDDQGWRIQIDSWPNLTAIGGSTEVGGGPGGFFTKQDYAAIVRYSQDRFITVVPEIDMPAHTNAAIASYPQLGCSNPTPGVYGGTQGPGVYTGIAVGFSALCPDSEVVYKFIDDVVREIAAMTPGPYFHMGGDEVQALTNEQYSHFVERVQDIVNKYGKTMVGWEEIGKARLKPTTLAQQWKSDSALVAFRQGAKLILSPGSKTYLDMKYTPATELGLDWAGFVELQTAYDWDPVTFLAGVPEQSVMGVEAPLWSETVQNITAAEYMVVPRLPAIAEVGWSPASLRSWESFRTRVAAHAPRWRLLGINYYPSPQVAW
jgi:hexosaminidase